VEVTPSDESSMKVIPVIFTISREHADWKVAIGIDGSSAVTISQCKSTRNGVHRCNLGQVHIRE
jgi:hypothetical protein